VSDPNEPSPAEQPADAPTPPPTQPAAPPPMPGAPGAPPARSSNGFAVTSLVLGILSIVLFFTIWIPFILAILAIIFGALGISNARKGAPRKGMAIAGLICGIAGVVIAVLFIVLIVSAVNDPEFQDVFSSVFESPISLVRAPG
jgi:Domain of unknown function (DUF4190)